MAGHIRPQCKVGYFINPLIIGLYVITELTFKPTNIEFFISKNDGLKTWFCEGHGWVDEFLNQNCSAWTGNYSNTFRGDMKIDKCLYAFNASGIIQVEATLVSMNNNGFTLNFTVAGNTAFTIRWKASL